MPTHKKRKPNPLRSDPTRQATLRRIFVREFVRRFERIRKKLVRLIVDQNAFGLELGDERTNNQNQSSRGAYRHINNFQQQPSEVIFTTTGSNKGIRTKAERDTQNSRLIARGNGSTESDKQTNKRKVWIGNAGRWRALTDQQKVKQFEKWLKENIDEDVLGGEEGKATIDDYWKKYSEQAFQKGQGRAFDDVKKPATAANLDFYNGTKDQFLRSSFGRPVNIRKLKQLSGRVFEDLKNVTKEMSLQMTKILVDGLAQGMNPHTISRLLSDRINKIGKTRATIIARTEITRSHAEGQLSALEELGVEEVGVQVEWSTAGDDRVCPLCQPLEGTILKIKEASGAIPRHPQCVIGDSVIESDDVLSIMKSHFTGEIVKITTTKGRSLSITPNHILLTQYGFLPARFLYKGLNVVDATSIKSIVNTPNDYSREACISDIFTTISKYSAMSTDSMPLAPKDFHGDGSFCNSEIDIVWANCELRDESQRTREIIKLEFPTLQFVDSKAPLSRLSSAAQFLKRTGRTFDSSVGRFREFLALFTGQILHSKIHGLTPITGLNPSIAKSFVDGSSTTLKSLRQCVSAHPILKQFNDFIIGNLDEIISSGIVSVLPQLQIDSSLFQSTANSVIANLELGSKLCSSFSGKIQFDQISSIDIEHVSNLPVYDVCTDSTLYRVNGIISSNCRCAFLPANVGESKKIKDRPITSFRNPETGKIESKKIPVKTTKIQVDKAIRDSIKAEFPKGTDIPFKEQREATKWVGADIKVAKDRGQSILDDAVQVDIKPIQLPKSIKKEALEKETEEKPKSVKKEEEKVAKKRVFEEETEGLTEEEKRRRAEVEEIEAKEKLEELKRELLTRTEEKCNGLTENAEDSSCAASKSEIAKANHKLVGKDIQRYSEERNELDLASKLGKTAKAMDNNLPHDVEWLDGDKLHGIELKTMVENKANKITMKRSAVLRKQAWERKNKGVFHTVIFDDELVIPGKNIEEKSAAINRLLTKGDTKGFDSKKRKIFYKRGSGSFRTSAMQEVNSIDELKELIRSPKRKLPPKAKIAPKKRKPKSVVVSKKKKLTSGPIEGATKSVDSKLSGLRGQIETLQLEIKGLEKKAIDSPNLNSIKRRINLRSEAIKSLEKELVEKTNILTRVKSDELEKVRKTFIKNTEDSLNKLGTIAKERIELFDEINTVTEEWLELGEKLEGARAEKSIARLKKKRKTLSDLIDTKGNRIDELAKQTEIQLFKNKNLLTDAANIDIKDRVKYKVSQSTKTVGREFVDGKFGTTSLVTETDLKLKDAEQFLFKITSKNTGIDNIVTNSHRLPDMTRAFHSSGSNVQSGIYLSPQAKTKVYVHEMGHRIENTIPRAKELAEEFRIARIARSGTRDIKFVDLCPECG